MGTEGQLKNLVQTDVALGPTSHRRSHVFVTQESLQALFNKFDSNCDGADRAVFIVCEGWL